MTTTPPLSITIESNVINFWKQGVFHYFSGLNGLKIQYAYFFNKLTSPSIVVSSGRCESYLKYQETLYELSQRGYNVFILDHRGQGLSDRLLPNLEKGYVKHFDDYAHDLYQFITTVVLPITKNRLPYILAHSMGGAITIRTLQLYPRVIERAALLSPMIAINTGGVPKALTSQIVTLGRNINQIFTKQPWYFLGQSNYQAKGFQNNPLSHSQKRYQKFIDLYNKHPTIQLGGVTFHWLYQALQAEKNIFLDLNKIKTPLCVLQASDDSIVDNKVQDLFCNKLHQLSPSLCPEKIINIEGAYHELLFEKDNIRTAAIEQVIQFFKGSTIDCGS